MIVREIRLNLELAIVDDCKLVDEGTGVNRTDWSGSEERVVSPRDKASLDSVKWGLCSAWIISVKRIDTWNPAYTGGEGRQHFHLTISKIENGGLVRGRDIVISDKKDEKQKFWSGDVWG